jgi:hypothetical protein
LPWAREILASSRTSDADFLKENDLSVASSTDGFQSVIHQTPSDSSTHPFQFSPVTHVSACVPDDDVVIDETENPEKQHVITCGGSSSFRGIERVTRRRPKRHFSFSERPPRDESPSQKEQNPPGAGSRGASDSDADFLMSDTFGFSLEQKADERLQNLLGMIDTWLKL